MKKWIACLVSLVLAFALLLTGCGSEETNAPEKTQWEAIQETKELRIAFEGAWAPWCYHDEEDKLVGFDKEIGDALAKELGVEAKFFEVEWSGLFAGLDSGRYDVIINGIEYTEERAKKYDFSDPYAFISTVIITKDDNDTIHSFEDLNGKTTCNSLQSTYMMLAEQFGATCMGVETLEETIDMVLAGRVDATLNAEGSFFDYMIAHPDAPIKVAATYSDASNVCVLVRKGEETAAFQEKLNAAIQKLHDNGTLSALSEKYFGKDITRAAK